MCKDILPEMRKDPTSGQWSVVARKEKNKEEEQETYRYCPPKSDRYLKRLILPLKDKDCPFSQSYSGGRRQEKDPIFGLRWNGDEVEFVWDEKLEERKKLWYSDNWEVMIVEHDFAQVNRHIDPFLFGHGPFLSLAGFGIHDLIIEDPTEDHKPLGVMPWKRTMLILLAMLYRLKGDLGLKNSLPCFPKFNPAMVTSFSKMEGIRHVSFFHNYLREAGASQEHPHSQIIASPIIPTAVAAELDYLHKRYDEPPGRCIYCQVIETELNDRKRVLFENDSFLAIHPYAPVYPFEIWILPKRHNSSYASIIPEDYSADKPNPLVDLAQIVNDVVGRLYVSLRNPGYNLILKTEPIRREGDRHYMFHWHIRIETRGLYKPAGFEMGTGIYSCETPPEEAVAFLQKWGALAEGENTHGSLQWYMKEIRDLKTKLEKGDVAHEEETQIVWEASQLLEILPHQGQKIQRGLELRSRIEEIREKYPQLMQSRYQQKYPDEPRQRINILPKEFEKTEGPHYRSDPSSYRWVLVPSKKRRVTAQKHADEVQGWRKEEAEKIYKVKEKCREKIVDEGKKFKGKCESLGKDIFSGQEDEDYDKTIKKINEKINKQTDLTDECKKQIDNLEEEIKKAEEKLLEKLTLRDDRERCPFCEISRLSEKDRNIPIIGLKEKNDSSTGQMGEDITLEGKDKWKEKDGWDVFLIENLRPILNREVKQDIRKLPILEGSGPFQHIEGKGICDVIVVGDGNNDTCYIDSETFKVKENETSLDKTLRIHRSLGKMDKKYTRLILYAVMIRLGAKEKSLKGKIEKILGSVKSEMQTIYPDKSEKSGVPGPVVKHVTIFSNHGQDAGARIAHPTWQIMGTPIIPTEIQRELVHAKAYFDENSCRCCFCDMIGAELNLVRKKSKKNGPADEELYNRIIYPYPNNEEKDGFIVLAPFAARVPFELVILPLNHQSTMYEMSITELENLAEVLHKTLKALSETLKDPPYSLVIKNAPIPPQGQEHMYAHYHWRIVIEPQRLAIPAGYEHLTGIWSNPTPPEEYAKVLREKLREIDKKRDNEIEEEGKEKKTKK